MRQIEMLIAAIIQKFIKGEAQETAQDIEIRAEIERLLSKKDICAAENYLFARAQENDLNPAFLKTALDFYAEINKLTDEELEQCNFTRGEIYDGIKEICRICNADDASFYIIQ